MTAVPSRSFMSIGEVLASLRGEFPDVTISKIRFLEAEGLVEPERTASGYRKFSRDDIARLRPRTTVVQVPAHSSAGASRNMGLRIAQSCKVRSARVSTFTPGPRSRAGRSSTRSSCRCSPCACR